MRDLFIGHPVEIDGEDVDVQDLAYDSRQVAAGSLFAALPGRAQDGHDHVKGAVDRGAVAVLCERDVETAPATRVRTANARLALAYAARRLYDDPAARLSMIGVTGTNGKTTVVNLVEGILRAAGQRPAVIGTLGTRYETPSGTRAIPGDLTTPQSVDLLELLDIMHRAGTSAVAMEVSSHALEQERVAGVDYDVAAFTNLSHDHLDYHGTLEAYFAAKAKLFAARLKPGARVVLNLDDPRVRTLATNQSIGFSMDPASGARLVLGETSLDQHGINARIRSGGALLEIASPLIGRFNIENILCAVGIGIALGIEPEAMATGIAQVSSVPGRLERVSQRGEPLVLVDYAHTPDALRKSLAAVREVTAGRVICVFGCGGDRDVEKRRPMGEAAAHADWVVLTSDNPRTEDPAAIAAAAEAGLQDVGPRDGYSVELDRQAAIEQAVRAAAAGDAVLVAGKGHEDYQIVGRTRRPFDDRRHARAALDRGAAGDGGEEG